MFVDIKSDNRILYDKFNTSITGYCNLDGVVNLTSFECVREIEFIEIIILVLLLVLLDIAVCGVSLEVMPHLG